MDTKSPEGFTQHDAPKRPKKLPCNIDTVRIGKEKFTVLVGLLDEKPYEVFVIPSEIMKGYGTGTITKRGKGVYTLSCSVGEEVSILDDFTTSMTDEEEALTRLVSTSLRHGANVKFICEQLLKTKGELNSFSKAIARVLKSHIPDGEKSTMLCDNCGEDALVFEEGCQTCKSCGNSKCS
jgi:ribonucleoside-diphosphate reductase alpha chain